MRRFFVLAAACASLLAVLLFGTPAQADVLIAVNKSTQSMSVVVDGRERYRWPVSTGLDGGPPSRAYQPERMERLWHSRKYDWSPMPHAIFSPSWICHPRHRLRAAARPACLAWLRAAAPVACGATVRAGAERGAHADRGVELGAVCRSTLVHRCHSITISPTMPRSAWVLPSVPTMPQRRSPTRPVATGTNHHSALCPG